VCLLYINKLRVVSLSFIVLPELVKHILVAGVVGRNIKFNVKIFNIRHVLHCAVADDAVMPIRAESSWYCCGDVLVLRFLCWRNGSIRLTVYN